MKIDSEIAAKYPNIVALLEKSDPFVEDIGKARRLCSEEGERRFGEEYRAGSFHASQITYFLCSPIMTSYNECAREAVRLDDDLRTAIESARLAPARKAFRDKLLTDRQFEDTRYEIAVAGVACRFFDPDTVSLETKLAGSGRNSDVRGQRTGRPWRIETTVVHEEWPPGIPTELQTVLESASIPVGYELTLREPIRYIADAERVVAIIEAVYAVREKIGEQKTEVNDVSVQRTPGTGTFCVTGGPIDELLFDDRVPENRTVAGPAFTRPMMDQHEWDDVGSRNPPGVVTLADLAHRSATHNRNPVSTKLWQILNGKRAQCEPGHSNVVVLGIPVPTTVEDVRGALLGAPIVETELCSDRTMGGSLLQRHPTGPFVPASQSADAAQWVTPFTVVSAVATLRLGATDTAVHLFVNPNADVPISHTDAEALEKHLTDRCS